MKMRCQVGGNSWLEGRDSQHGRTAETMTVKKAMTLIEVLVVMAAVLLFLLVTTAGRSLSDDYSKRKRCAANIRGIGQALYIYAQDDPFLFPVIGLVRKQNDGAMVVFDKENRTREPGTESLPSPTVDLWAVVRAHHSRPNQFICPTTTDVTDPVRDVTAYYDFASSKHLSACTALRQRM